MLINSQRDKQIALLAERVAYLEREVAKLSGRSPRDETEPFNTIETPSGEDFFFEETPAIGPTPIRSSKEESLERTIGTRWFGRVGILAILFGVAFFLKYSFDNKLIGETGRVLLGLFCGCAFIGGGEYLQKRPHMARYGQLLCGGGLAILYLALYAAFALYHLIPSSLAAVAMIAVTTTGLMLSVRYSAYVLAVFALLGGFLTPVMLSTGQNQPVSLFTYVLLLNAGAMLLLRFRYWPSLVQGALAGTVLLYLGWHLSFINKTDELLAFAIQLTFFVFYNVFVIINRAYLKHREGDLDQTLVFGSAMFFLLAFFAQQDYHWTWSVKSITLALAAVEIGLAWLVRRIDSTAQRTIASYAVASMVVTVIATFITMGKQWLLPALATEMALFGWLGAKTGTRFFRLGAYLLSMLVLLRFTLDIECHLQPFDRFWPILNERFFVCFTAIIGFYVLTWSTHRYRDRLPSGEKYAVMIFFVASQLLSLWLLSTEIHDLFLSQSSRHQLYWTDPLYGFQLSLSVLWALYSSILIAAGIYRQLRGVRVMGIILFCLTVLKVFLLDLSSLQTLYRIMSFIVLGILLLIVSYGYNRYKHFIFGENQ